MKLSKRLEEIARRVPQGRVVADIGSDHGQLPVALVREGIASRCVAVDRLPRPLAVARRTVARAGVDEQVELRLGDGLEPLSPGEVQVVCVAGMGGATIAGILERGRERLAGVERLVLQPNGGDERLRRHLLKSGWRLVDEAAIEERGRFYVIMVAERGDAEAPYLGQALGQEALLRVGPLLVAAPTDAMRRRWRRERAHLDRVMEGVGRRPSPENQAKLLEVEREVALVDAILKQLGQGG